MKQKISSYFCIMVAALIGIGLSACGNAYEKSEEGTQATRTVEAPLHFNPADPGDADGFVFGLTGDFNVHLGNCTMSGPVVDYASTMMTEATLSFALLDGGDVCQDYCLELVDDDGNPETYPWDMYYADEGDPLTDSGSWTIIPDSSITLASNMVDVQVCESVASPAALDFTWVAPVSMYDYGITNVVTNVTINTCSGLCESTEEADIGELACLQANTDVNPEAPPACYKLCDGPVHCAGVCGTVDNPETPNNDTNGLCVAGEPGNGDVGGSPGVFDDNIANPGFCICLNGASQLPAP